MRNQRPEVASPGRPGFSLNPVVVCPGNLGRSRPFLESHFPICTMGCACGGVLLSVSLVLSCGFLPGMVHAGLWLAVCHEPYCLVSLDLSPCSLNWHLELSGSHHSLGRTLWAGQLGGGRAGSRKLGRESLLGDGGGGTATAGTG